MRARAQARARQARQARADAAQADAPDARVGRSPVRAGGRGHGAERCPFAGARSSGTPSRPARRRAVGRGGFWAWFAPPPGHNGPRLSSQAHAPGGVGITLANHVHLPTSRQSQSSTAQTRTASSKAARAVSGMVLLTLIEHLINIQHYRGMMFGKQYSIQGTDAGHPKFISCAYLETWKCVAPQDKARCLGSSKVFNAKCQNRSFWQKIDVGCSNQREEWTNKITACETDSRYRGLKRDR